MKQSKNIKFDIRNIPNELMKVVEIVTKLNQFIQNLELSVINQLELDNKYNDLVTIIHDEMNSKLTQRKVVHKDGLNNKRRKMKKPWWNDNLTALWNEVCKAERKWNRSHNQEKRKLRHIFVDKRTPFDKNCQQTKRQYWYRSQDELLNIQNKGPREFWKNISKIGVSNERQKSIPMEVVLEDGSICTDTDIILNTWTTAYENLLNCDDVVNLNDNMSNNILDVDLDSEISIDEVLKVLTKVKNGKAPGIDLIPVELYINNLLLHVLHKLFNICFKFGKIPSVWFKVIITPIP